MNGKLSLMTLNIRSLTKHLSQLKETIEEFPTEIIALCEIWKPNKQFVKLPKYQEIITKTRPTNKSGGGVGLYFSQKLTYEPHDEINKLKLKIIEIVGAKVKMKNQTQISS